MQSLLWDQGWAGGQVMADEGGGRELLEPRLGAEESREKLVLHQKSCICTVQNVVFR